MSQQPNQRILAAIVFTDVVGFSARMQIEEEKTISLVKRDLIAFEKICLHNGGRIIKNTGDGLMMFFSSLDAALKTGSGILEYLDTATRTFTPDKRLEHRLGVHLGDVITNGNDVLGDGVNIAARLMGEAQPDTICISYSAFEFVKNRTKLHSQFIGPRQLKNIKDPITAVLLSFRPPLDVLVPANTSSATVKPASTPLNIPTKILYIGAPLLALLFMIGAYFYIGPQPVKPADLYPPDPNLGKTALGTTLPSEPPLPQSSPTPDLPALTKKIDALALLDPKRDAIRGNWTRSPSGDITCDAIGLDAPFIANDDSPSAARICLPIQRVQIPREYDFNVSFTRSDGKDSVALIFVSGDNTAAYEIDAWDRNMGGIQNVDFKNMQAFPDSTFKLKAEPGRRYTTTLQVRRDKLTMIVDGQVMATLPSDGSNLSLQAWTLRQNTPLGVGAFRSSVTFHTIEIVPVQ